MSWMGNLFSRKSHTDPIAGERITIPAGPFIMGSTDEQAEGFIKEATEAYMVDQNLFDRETPQRTVPMPQIIIDKYPVTCHQYHEFCRATGHDRPENWKRGKFPKGHENHPVTHVSIQNAMAYCKWAGGRLPYESEWEKAARGDDGRIWPWGNEPDPNRSNSDKAGDDARTQPVDAYPDGASPYGCMDMIGNVMEWTWDQNVAYPGFVNKQREPGGGGMTVTVIGAGGQVVENPVFMPSNSTVRGGSYQTIGGLCRCASRLNADQASEGPCLGFRCVYSPDPAEDAAQHLQAGNLEKAIDVFATVLSMSPTHPSVSFNAAVAYRRAGQFEQAIEIWKRVLDSWPDDYDARSEMQRCEQKDSTE